MKSKGKIFEKIKDGLIITRIRITNFMKEHKYLSAVIGVFLLSSIIALAALALSADDPSNTYYRITVNDEGVTARDIASSAETTSDYVDSFSTVVFNIPYTLSLADLPSNVDRQKINPNRVVIVEASIPDDLDAQWQQPFDGADYEIIEDTEHHKNIIKATIYDVNVGSNNKQLYLDVYNIENATKIKLDDFKIYEESTSSDNYTTLSSPIVEIHSETVTLTAKPYDGNAYKGDLDNGRYAAFGILVGLETDKSSLKGLYFNPNIDIKLEANQTLEGSSDSDAVVLKNEEGYYGVLNKSDKANILNSLPNFASLPNGVSNNHYISSGNVRLVKDTTNPSESNEKTTPKLRLVGPTEITLGKGETYNELGIELVSGEEKTSLCKTNGNGCTREIIGNGAIGSSLGEYTIKYKYIVPDTLDVVTLIRKVTVIDKKTVAKGNNNQIVYTLDGYDNEVLLVNEDGTYEDAGVKKNGIKLKESENEYTATTINTSNPGDYQITYTIPVDNETITLVRNVKVLSVSDYYTSAPIVKTKIKYVSLGSENVSIPKPNVDGEDINNCNSSSHCDVIYKKGTEIISDTDNITANNVGNYDVIYTITDDNGFEVNTSTKIIVQAKYILKVSDIKTDGAFTKKDGMLVLGSYYVTAISPRTGSSTEKINVKLIADENTNKIAQTINEYISYGTKNVELHLYDSVGSNEIVNSHIPYGQEVILSSVFSYSRDGDNNLNVTNIIPLSTSSYLNSMGVSGYTETAGLSNNVFTLTKYASESGLTYNVTGSGDNIDAVLREISVKYYSCNADKTPKCKAYDDYDAYLSQKTDGDVLAYLTYTLNGVKPGSKIDFRVRAIVNVDVSGQNQLKSSVSYSADSGTFKNSETVNVNVTPFTARSRILIDDEEQDIMVDGASKNTSTLKIYPTVSMPAQLISSTAGGISKINTITVSVTLPEHVSYVYNDEYLKPTISGKTLTYKLTNKKLNDWIDPIILDISYDVNTPSNSNLKINVLTQASASSYGQTITDLSSATARTTTRSIAYVNTKNISSSLYSSSSGISKSTSFEVQAKLYNNSGKQYNQTILAMVLPYNDETHVFNGSYTLSNVPSNAYCSTTNTANLITADNFAEYAESFQECSNFSSDNYKNVTVIALQATSFSSGEVIDGLKVTIVPKDNKTDDVYQIKAFYTAEQSGNEITKGFISPLQVKVISKKITGVVWEDFDANGVMDQGEKKISDITLNLYNSVTNEFIKSTTSNSKGVYSFTDLDPGKYYIIAEVNGVKYGLSPTITDGDKSKTSSFAKADVSLEKTEEATAKTENSSQSGETEEDNKTNPEEEKPSTIYAKTAEITITNNTKVINDINLGLSLNRVYAVKVRKFVSKAITTNRLGVSTIRDYGNVTLAKLDVKDIANLSIKVVYTIELENVGYFPGYIYNVKDYVPDGMKFNPNYPENAGWIENEEGYLENNSLADVLISGGEKKYLTIAFDITRKEAGSFVNWAYVDDEDLQILEVYKEEGAGE